MRTPLAMGLVFLVVVGVAGRGGAEEGAGWERAVLGAGPVGLWIPPGWERREGAQGHWLEAFDPEAAATGLSLTRHDLLGTDEELEAFAARQLAEERGATIREAGFRVDDRVEKPVAGTPALWTLVARPRAAPPRRSLYVHFLHGGHGYALRVDVPLGTFHARRAFVRRLVVTLHLDAKAGATASTSAALARALRALEREPPHTPAQYRAWFEELRVLGEAALPHLRALVERYVRGPGADDRDARAFLGHRAFDDEVPDWIAFRGHAFLRAVERAAEKRWFTPEEAAALALAERAREEAEAHGRRLARDPAYRTADQAFANLAHDPALADKHLRFRWAEPYVLCWVGEESLSPYDALLLPDGAAREAALGRLGSRAVRATRVLDAKALVLTQVYREFLRRYGERFGLRPLMGPWGGRADLGAHRSFSGGAPLVVLVHEAEATYYESTRLPRGAPLRRLFSPRTGALSLCVEGEETGNLEAATRDATAATEQLLYWFTRQRNRWRHPRHHAGAFKVGFGAWLGGVAFGRQGELEFTGVNAPLLDRIRRLARHLEFRGDTYRLFPLERLLSFDAYGQAMAWGAVEWSLPPQVGLSLYEQQTWAWVRFLHEHEDGAHREALLRLLDAELSRETGSGRSREVHAKALGLRSEEDWRRLEEAWTRYVREELLTELER